VLTTWSQTDAPGAAAYALTLPAGQDRNQALSGVAGQWAQMDAEAAAAWVKSLPTGPGSAMRSAT